MSSIVITLHRASSLFGRLIQWQTRGEYSHAGLILPDGSFVEAREGEGVRVLQTLAAVKGETVDLFTVEATPDQVAKVVAFTRSQVGKPYDWTMVLRFVSRRKESGRTTEKWFCSELVYAAFRDAGIHLFRETQPWEVSPGMLARSPLLKPFK